MYVCFTPLVSSRVDNVVVKVVDFIQVNALIISNITDDVQVQLPGVSASMNLHYHFIVFIDLKDAQSLCYNLYTKLLKLNSSSSNNNI